MRNVRLVQLLVVAALLAVPVAAISAQSGMTSGGYVWDGASDWPGVTSIAIPEVLPATGASSAPLPFYLQRDSVRATQALSETGSNMIPVPAIKNWRFEGFTLVPDFADTAPPAALPETGASGAGIGSPSDPPLIGDGARAAESVVRQDASLSDPPLLTTAPPAALPETGATSGGLTGMGTLEERERLETYTDIDGLMGQDGLKRLDPTQDCRWC